MNIARISPTKAILICINSMIGAGLFINTKPLTELAGCFGFLGYVFAALILLPLIICIAELAALHPVAGGLYVYSKTHIGSLAGFISAWAYFVGKTTSAAILMHKFIEFFQARSAVLHSIPTLYLDFVLLFSLMLANSAGVSVGGRIQYVFTCLKATPIIFAFFVGFTCFDTAKFTDLIELQNILYTLPIAIFPLLGFEVICAIGNMIEDAQQNIKRVIMTAFALVTATNIIFQLLTFMALGDSLKNISEPILVMGKSIFITWPVLASILNGAVFASIIGACFSVLTSNCWNLHTIARFGHLPGQSLLTKVNSNNVPYVSLFIECVIGCIILSITSAQVPLQNMSVFAQVISYLFSSLATFYAITSGAIKNISRLVPLLAVASCSFVMGICMYRLYLFGISFPFIALLMLGYVIAGIKQAINAYQS